MRNKLFRIFILVFVILILINSLTEDSDRTGSSTSASQKKLFKNTLALEDQNLADEVYNTLKNSIKDKLGAEYSRAQKVKREHSDLLALTQKKTNGGIDEDQAVQLIDVLADDMSATNKVFDAEKTLSIVMDQTAKQIENKTNLNSYQSKQKIFKAVNATWPHNIQYFKPENKLNKVDFELLIPESNSEYEELLNDEKFYDHQLYQDLQTTKEELPNEALVVLLKLNNKPMDNHLLREGWIVRPEKIIAQYESRACDAVIDYLINPSKYGQKFSRPPYYTMSLLKSCPEEKRRAVIEASLSSGWKAIENYLPGNEEWADALLDQYEDSPYGPAVRNKNARPLTQEEQQIIEAKLEEFKTEFKALENPDYQSYRKLKEKFKFEERKLENAFADRAYNWWNKEKN